MKKAMTSATPKTIITEELKAQTIDIFAQYGLSKERIAEYNDLVELKKEIDKRYNAMKKTIQSALEELEVPMTEFAGFEIEVVTTYRKDLDRDKLKNDLGDLLPEYQKDTAVRSVKVREA